MSLLGKAATATVGPTSAGDEVSGGVSDVAMADALFKEKLLDHSWNLEGLSVPSPTSQTAAFRSILKHRNIPLVETMSSFCKRDISIFHVNLLYNPHSIFPSHIHLLYRLHQLHHKPYSNLHALDIALTLVSCTQFEHNAHILVCFLICIHQ